jgi:hypothetical protein
MELKWQDPLGYQEITNKIKSTNYGWAVINSRGEIVVVRVYDWCQACQTMPYRWLNTHPLQPSTPAQTFDLALKTLEAFKKASKLIEQVE